MKHTTFEDYLRDNTLNESNLNESSMTRFIRKFAKHNAAIITAYRGEFTKAENQARNKRLFSAMFAKGYSVTSVKGSYIENKDSDNEREVSENSFVVVNHNDDKDFNKTILKLGEVFDQDSVLLIDKGDMPKAKLVGTSKRDNSFPGYKKTIEFDKMTLNTKSQEFFTRLNKKTFAFPDNVNESELYDTDFYPQTINGIRAAKVEGYKFLVENDLV